MDIESIDDCIHDGKGAKDFSDTHGTSRDLTEDEDRDEVKEVLKLSEKHTSWMRRLRAVVFLLLLLTGVTVTSTTYALLRDEQEQDFRLAVSTKHNGRDPQSSNH